MDKSVPTISSGADLDEEKSKFRETLARKFKFLGTLKNYIFSKLRKEKYNLDDSPPPAVSIVSYDQRGFEDAEKALDSECSQTIKLDPRILQALKTALNSKINDPKPNANLELLDIVERTFARQMDIFEGLLKHINSKSESDKVKLQRKLRSSLKDRSLDLNYIINNLVTELNANSNAQQITIALNDDTPNPGDNPKIKKPSIECECRQAGASGGAVPRTQ
ncbi:uncharacterized protein LOC135265926 [Tribolium castaneum]